MLDESAIRKRNWEVDGKGIHRKQNGRSHGSLSGASENGYGMVA